MAAVGRHHRRGDGVVRPWQLFCVSFVAAMNRVDVVNLVIDLVDLDLDVDFVDVDLAPDLFYLRVGLGSGKALSKMMFFLLFKTL